MEYQKKLIIALAPVMPICSIVLTGCAPGGGSYQKDSPAWFFSGI
jgi:hypothetical protein